MTDPKIDLTLTGTDPKVATISDLEDQVNTAVLSLALFPSDDKGSKELSAMPRVKSLRLYGADPSKFYSVKLLYWKDVGTRFSIVIQEHDDVDGTNAVDICSYVLGSGADSWNSVREIALSEVSSSGVTGLVVIDFTDTATAMTINTVPSSAADYQRRAIGFQATSVDDDHIRALAAAELSDDLALKAPLASPVFTGDPEAPTQSAGDDSTKLATTEFVQQEIGSNSSATDIAEVRSIFTGFITPPAIDHPLNRIISIALFKSSLGVTVDLPDQITVREIARDNADRFRFHLAAFDGVSTYDVITTEDNSNTGSLNVSGFTGQKWLKILASGTSLGLADNAEVGRVLIDFKNGDTFGTYTSTYDHSVGGLYLSRLKIDERLQNDIQEIATEVISRSPGAQIPFADEVTGSDVLRSVIRDVKIYGADPTHQYVISTFVVEQFGSPTNLTRFRFQIDDITDDVTACSMRYQEGSGTVTFADFIDVIPDRIKLTDFLLATNDKTGIYAVAEIDWSKLTDYFSDLGGSTVAEAGLHKSTVYSDEMISDYLDGDHWHQVIRCGADETYTTLRAAVEATYSPLTGSTLVEGSPICEFSHYHNRVLIDIVDDGDFQATGLFIPDFVEVRGNGADRTFIRRENTDAEPLVEQRSTGKFFDCTMISETPSEYCLHPDDFNRHVEGGKSQNIRKRNSYKRMRLIGGVGHNGWLFGHGVSSGEHNIFEDIHVEHMDPSATEPGFGFHNSGPTLSTPEIDISYKPATVEMRGCSSVDQTAVELSTLEPSAKCSLILTSCSLAGLIKVETSSGAEVVSDLASERNAWRIGGFHDGPWLRIDPVGENVLKTAAGQTPSGDAAAVIFGSVDDLGRGDKWVGADGSLYDLGERLGDCSSVNKTLTIDGQSHVFTEDETSKTNATIISEINASLTNSPVSIVDIQDEWVPDAAPKRRMNNNTGSIIEKGRLVKFTSASTFAYCAAGEKPDGWTHRDVLNGDDGYVILTKRIADDYITNADTSTGEWGISTDGQLDYAAGTKLGRTIGGITEIY